ncbi:prepilin peptidase [Adlercreutzia sp. ZJ154]|uniref:prepilin peptidase n=1 Tax=Adlercreutzia sp. ZJ154 TaxID=2709790 RepID=UPI0013EBDC55|nr:prepilin peptidase [Adlercreutzia sp. ZJ154]
MEALAVVTSAAFVVLLVAACITDLRARLIPNWIVIAMCAVWLAGEIVEITICKISLPDVICSLGTNIATSLIFGGGLLLFTLAFEAITNKSSMGGGDIKLLATCALYLGLQRSALCLLIACAVSIPLALIIPHTPFAQKDEGKGALPFAPAIAIGAIIAMVF